MILILLGIPMAFGQAQDALDRRDTPPIQRRFTSPGGAYELVVTSPTGWKTRHATAELLKGKDLVWKKPILQSFGPRDAVVTQDGQVAFFDEWINVASTIAILLVDETGKERARFSFGDICRITGKPAKDLTRGAAAGPYGRGTWMSSRPEAKCNSICVIAAGVVLELDLGTGQLARAKKT